MCDHNYVSLVYLYYWMASTNMLHIYTGQIDRDGYFIKEGSQHRWFYTSREEGGISYATNESNNSIKNFWFWLRPYNEQMATEIIMNHFNAIICDAEESKNNALSVLTTGLIEI